MSGCSHLGVPSLAVVARRAARWANGGVPGRSLNLAVDPSGSLWATGTTGAQGVQGTSPNRWR